MSDAGISVDAIELKRRHLESLGKKVGDREEELKVYEDSASNVEKDGRAFSEQCCAMRRAISDLKERVRLLESTTGLTADAGQYAGIPEAELKAVGLIVEDVDGSPSHGVVKLKLRHLEHLRNDVGDKENELRCFENGASAAELDNRTFSERCCAMRRAISDLKDRVRLLETTTGLTADIASLVGIPESEIQAAGLMPVNA